MKEKALFEKLLASNGHSKTKTRGIVFDLLLSVQKPQTMHQLIEALEGKVDRVTMYRIIELYERLGIVQRINVGWKYKIELSDVFLGHHHHLTCLDCGRVMAVKNEHGVEEMIQRLAKINHFVLTSHQLELQGYCEHCMIKHSK